jgi:toxin ParE1/3/4
MIQYIINVRATQDLSEISEYLAEISLERSDRFLQDFDRKCRQIVNFPLSGKSYTEIRPDLRGMVFQGYLIFYRVLESEIEIMRVIAGRRDLTSLFDRPS